MNPEINKTTNHKAPQAYRGNGKHAWERVAATAGTITIRLRVPGGWIYATDTVESGMTTVFVPTPAHII